MDGPLIIVFYSAETFRRSLARSGPMHRLIKMIVSSLGHLFSHVAGHNQDLS